MAFVDVQGLNKVYQLGAQRIHVLRDLELHVAYGEMVAIVGASGVGKSTLLHLLGGLDRADSGQIVVADTIFARSTMRRSSSSATGTSASSFSSII